MNENSPVSLTELPAVARNIHLPCKKCECDRYFVVLAHTSATSAKVKCEVCGSTKVFKLAKAAKAQESRKTSGSSTTAKARGLKKTIIDSAAIWNELKTQIGTDKIVPYNMKARFALANAINHPKFGVGFVTNATNEKIDVAFEEGGRSLVHNRTT